LFIISIVQYIKQKLVYSKANEEVPFDDQFSICFCPNIKTHYALFTRKNSLAWIAVYCPLKIVSG